MTVNGTQSCRIKDSLKVTCAIRLLKHNCKDSSCLQINSFILYTLWCVKAIFLLVLEDLSVWCLSSCVNHLINHSCISDLNTTGGLPGHHVNESIRCVLTHEIRPNEMCLNLKHKATKEILKNSFSFLSWFVSPIFLCPVYLCRRHFQTVLWQRCDELSMKLAALQTSHVPPPTSCAINRFPSPPHNL